MGLERDTSRAQKLREFADSPLRGPAICGRTPFDYCQLCYRPTAADRGTPMYHGVSSAAEIRSLAGTKTGASLCWVI